MSEPAKAIRRWHLRDNGLVSHPQGYYMEFSDHEADKAAALAAAKAERDRELPAKCEAALTQLLTYIESAAPADSVVIWRGFEQRDMLNIILAAMKGSET